MTACEGSENDSDEMGEEGKEENMVAAEKAVAMQAGEAGKKEAEEEEAVRRRKLEEKGRKEACEEKKVKQGWKSSEARERSWMEAPLWEGISNVWHDNGDDNPFSLSQHQGKIESNLKWREGEPKRRKEGKHPWAGTLPHNRLLSHALLLTLPATSPKERKKEERRERRKKRKEGRRTSRRMEGRKEKEEACLLHEGEKAGRRTQKRSWA